MGHRGNKIITKIKMDEIEKSKTVGPKEDQIMCIYI